MKTQIRSPTIEFVFRKLVRSFFNEKYIFMKLKSKIEVIFILNLVG